MGAACRGNVEVALPAGSRSSGLLAEELGQAATEYALLALWTVIVIMASIEALEFALFDFYQDVATLICLPIP
jgi:Flp pilus assembly pilin Flp